MARVVQETRLGKREQRLRLAARKKPYWRGINEGQHLGYYRGARIGKWIARYRMPGTTGDYLQKTLGEADDTADADGSTILNWQQAQEIAVTWFDELKHTQGRKQGPYTVGDAFDDYLEASQAKSIGKTKARIEAILRPVFGAVDIRDLTEEQVRSWHLERSRSPAKLRTSKKAKIINQRPVEDENGIRRRKSTANRDLTVLKAALNWAYEKGRKVGSDKAWRAVTPFKNVDAAKLRYLSDDEARRLINGCDPKFRPMAQAALLTGARYGELASAKVQDFDPDAGVLMFVDTKAGKPRASYLEAEGLRLIKTQSNGKGASDLLFPRPDGGRWGASQQLRYMAVACENGKVSPAAGFHDLRRTYGARLARKGVPMAIIAEALGHADERITRKHYAHLAPSHVADVVRAAMGGMGVVEKANIEDIADRRGAA